MVLGFAGLVVGQIQALGLGAGVGPVALVLGAAGGVLFVAGLCYSLVSQLWRRRHLPPDRYRGPSVVLMLALAMVLGIAATIPVAADANALLFGDGRVSLLGGLVIVTSTQLALAAVAWLFVLRPNAVAFAMPLAGRRPLAALGAGLRWGVLAWLLASSLGVLVTIVLELLGLPVQPGLAAQQAVAILDPWLVIVAIVIVAPVAEEIFFRGVAFNAWLRERGTRFAFIGSSLLFAVVHLSLVAFVPIFVLGLALAWVYRRTGSLLAPIAMHATVNGISAGLALLLRFELVRPPV